MRIRPKHRKLGNLSLWSGIFLIVGLTADPLGLVSVGTPDGAQSVSSDENISTQARDQEASGESSAFRRVKNSAFSVGERLEFEIAYGVIKAGTATMSVADTQWVNGRPCYHILTTAKSNEFFDSLYKVRDTVESYIDIEGLFTWRFEKRLREGKYHADRFEEYDQRRNLVYTGKDTISIPPYAQDILSSFYFARTVPLKIGKSFGIDNFADGKVYPLKIVVHGKDRVKVPAGRFDCIVVEPVLEGEGLFNQNGRMAIWLTNDERRIPVLMKSKVLVGSIEARLMSIQTGVK
ncbi:MAG: DUF3108 domain-containing protein [bacterium]